MTLGDRMKMYEAQGAAEWLPGLPICARVDGRCFSSWTRCMERPFDAGLHAHMVKVTRVLAEETGALVGYTQSDEISLVLWHPDHTWQPWCGRKPHKTVSLLASLATVAFNDGAYARPAMFDCRAWVVPSLAEAQNYLLWREHDATKNSISMAARSVYSHKALHGKSGNEMQEMLFQKGINWNDYPAGFKRGTWVTRERVSRPFTAEEIEELPPLHDARKNPGLMVERVVTTETNDRPMLVQEGL